MSYDTYEQSVASGKPIELHDIASAAGNHWRMTTGESAVTYLSYEYEPDVIDRSDFDIGRVGEVSAMTVKLGRSNAFANQFIAAPLDTIVTDTVYRGHEGEWVTFWKGTLVSVKFDENAVATLRFEPGTSSMPRVGGRRRNQRLCDHALYCYGCNVNQENYKVTSTITNISGLTITSSAFATKADGWFVGGKIVVGNAYRLIRAHAANVVTVGRAFVDAEIGDSFTAYAGCDHTPATCNSKFGNKLNFGGNEYLPPDNPFKKNIIW